LDFLLWLGLGGYVWRVYIIGGDRLVLIFGKGCAGYVLCLGGWKAQGGAKSLSKVKMLFGKGRLHNDRQDAVGQIRKLICFWWIYKIWVRYEPTF
jgi:hypothetical protein